MISKRILLATVCLAVLIIAVGAYGYALYSEVSNLGSQLDELQREINLLKYRIGFTNTSKTFNFFWGGSIAEKFNVTTFWMNITFTRENETHLVITVETNDLKPRGCYVGLAFDGNGDGQIDGGGLIYSSGNTTVSGVLGPYRNGQRFFETIASDISFGEHTCTFDPQQGYTFIIPLNLKVSKLTSDLIHVEYFASGVWKVALEFCFGMELIA